MTVDATVNGVVWCSSCGVHQALTADPFGGVCAVCDPDGVQAKHVRDHTALMVGHAEETSQHRVNAAISSRARELREGFER